MLTKILSVPFALVLFLLPGGWLGVELDDERPLTVKSVVEGSPAAKAGIRAGDVFQSVNGRRIRNEEALFEMFAGFQPRQKIRLVMRRGGRQVELAVTLGKAPEEGAETPRRERPRREGTAARGKPYVGVEIEAADSGGLNVVEVKRGGPAARAGLRQGDVITAINRQRIRGLDDLDEVISGLRPGAAIALTLRRDGDTIRQRLVLGTFPREGATEKPRREPRRQPRRQPRQPAQSRVDERGFSNDYQGSLTQARRSGKPVLLVFGAGWCEACETLRKSLEHASLKEPLAGFVCVWLDTDKSGRIADRHEVQSLPHLEILDARGKCVAKMVGHQTPQALRAALVKHGAQQPKRRQPNRRQPSRRQPDRRQGNQTMQQMQQELTRLRQQLARLQRQQAEQQRTLQEILRRLRDR